MTSIPLDPQSFSDEDFRFRLGTVPGSAEEFFAWSTDAAAVLAERRAWFAADSQRYAALLPEGTAIAQELLESVVPWPMLRDAQQDLRSPEIGLLERLVMLSKQWEPDFVLIAPHRDEPLFTVAGGCVCFPSAWRLTDKLGQTIDQVHQPVPQLNSALSPQIDRLLARLRPGKCLVRSNWGVCRLPELNQHPERNLPSIQLPVRLEEAWLRREDQCLFALPRTGGIVFGIRVTHTSWLDVRSNRPVAHSVARSLRTMPLDMLDYKRLAEVREQLARLLDEDV
ncbi:MAG: hypothetical protein JWP89_318 [Schlesneria sp.]|nr:hypothetical protein [Schlesneria sp.]